MLPQLKNTGLMIIALAACAWADGAPATPASVAPAAAVMDKEKPSAPAANRKAYDDLYSEILKTLPQDGKAKVDSARRQDRKPVAQKTNGPGVGQGRDPDAMQKHNRDLQELPPAVKARVDKVLTELDSRRKEKETEFKELKQ